MEGKAFLAIENELEVVALGDFREAVFAFKTRRIELTFQGNTCNGERCGPQERPCRQFYQRRFAVARVIALDRR
jgi:hypothetical protein